MVEKEQLERIRARIERAEAIARQVMGDKEFMTAEEFYRRAREIVRKEKLSGSKGLG